MTYQEAIEILRQHNTWRRYNGPIADTPEMTNPTLLGEAIDVVCDYELTWQDMRFIVKTADEMLEESIVKVNSDGDVIAEMDPKFMATEELYYEEVLRRFNMRKNH